jgi:alpha-L-arabinofuranosidase
VGQSVPGKIESDRWYDIKIQLADRRIRCFLDGKPIHDLPYRPPAKTPDLAASCAQDTANGDIIVKLVSKSSEPTRAKLDLSELNRVGATAAKTVLTGDPLAENHFGQAAEVLPETEEIPAANQMEIELPSHSLTVVRFKKTLATEHRNGQ